MNNDRQDEPGEANAEEAHDRLHALETESHDSEFAKGRTGQGGHEDRIEKLEGARGLAVKMITSFRELYRDFIPFVAITIAAVSLYSALQQVEKIETAVHAGETSNVRNCTRANINAAIISLAAMKPPTNPPGTITKQISDRLYPVVECKESLEAGEAIPLSEREKRRYVAIVGKGRAPVLEGGRVIGSRSSVIEVNNRRPKRAGNP